MSTPTKDKGSSKNPATRLARHLVSQNKNRLQARGDTQQLPPSVRAPTAAPAAAQDGQFDLDLTYLTDEIIAMVRRARTTHRCEQRPHAPDGRPPRQGLPSSGAEALYRNPIEEVVRFLEGKHKARSHT